MGKKMLHFDALFHLKKLKNQLPPGWTLEMVGSRTILKKSMKSKAEELIFLKNSDYHFFKPDQKKRELS